MKAFLLVLCMAVAYATHESFNFILPAQKRECFFEAYKVESKGRKIEAFVLSGGNLDVLLTIHGPLSNDDVIKGTFENPIFSENIDAVKETDSETQTFIKDFEPSEDGTYGICLDNRKSRFMPKAVQLSVTPLVEVMKIQEIDNPKAEEVDKETLIASLSALSTIYNGLSKIRLQQSRDRHRLDLHSETNETNYNNVFTGSIIETLVFILVACFQILFVRRWFSSKSAAAKNSGKNWA